MKLICYLSNGYPSIEDSIRISKEYVQAGCDIIEVDLPCRNPYLESEFIRERMAKALENCDDYDKYFAGIIKIKEQNPTTRILLLAYEATILEIGVNKFIDFCVSNDFKDLIFVGLTNNIVKELLIEKGIRVSCYVQFQMLEEEVESALLSNGFVYLQAKPTNEVNPNFPKLKDCVANLRNRGITRPIYCGVGIASCKDIDIVRNANADAVFVGSSILKLHNDIPLMKKKIKDFKYCCL